MKTAMNMFDTQVLIISV